MALPDATRVMRHLHTAALMQKQLRGAALASHEAKLLREHRAAAQLQAQRVPPRTAS